MEPCAEISKIDYKLGQDNVQFLGLDAHNPVFVVSSLTIVAFVAGVLAFQTAAAAASVGVSRGPGRSPAQRVSRP